MGSKESESESAMSQADLEAKANHCGESGSSLYPSSILAHLASLEIARKRSDPLPLSLSQELKARDREGAVDSECMSCDRLLS